MATIFVEGLGNVEIQGEVPTKEEQQAIIEALDTSSTDIENQLLDEIPDSTDTPSLSSEDIGATETVIPEIIDPNLSKVGKPEAKGLEKIGIDRPTLEAAGAIFGSVPGAAFGLPGVVAGGTLGAAGMGQLHDVIQSTITDEPTNFGTQVERAKKDFQREALLQSFFAKIPGMWTAMRRFSYGKPEKKLYESAKRIGYPLSLNDDGNIIAKGYGRVIGVFPIAGGPVKTAASKKAIFLNKTADDTLNTFGPNVTLTKLGIDMSKASQVTYGNFRRVSSFFYDDFYKAVDKIGNTPVISTGNYKAALERYVKGIDSGKITGVKSPQKDAIYKYAKQTTKKIPNYINATQYKSLVEDIKYYTKLAKKEPFNIKVLTGLKSSLETDLRLLNKQSYRDNLLKNVYPLSKSKKKNLDPNILSDIATRLKFADKVYATGIENSIIKSLIKKGTIKKGADIVPIPGKRIFQEPTAGIFKKVDKNIFGTGFKVPGSLNADELGEALLKRNASPQFLDDLRTLVGEKQFTNFVRSKFQTGFNSSLITGPKKGQLIFDPYTFEKKLGMNTESGRKIMEIFLKDSKLTIQQLDDFFNVAKNHAGLKVPDVSSFVARRAVLGGTKSLAGGALMTVGVTQNPVAGATLIYLARRTSKILSDPKVLKDVMTVLDPMSPNSQTKVAVLKLIDGMISDSQTKEEENNFKLMREEIELMPLDEIKKGIEDTLNSSQQFLNMNSDVEEPVVEEPVQDNKIVPELPKDDQSFLPSSPNVNPAAFSVASIDQTGLTPSENAFLDEQEKVMKLRERGIA